MGHSQFSRIPLSSERQQKFLQDEIERYTQEIASAKKEKSGQDLTIKQMEATKKRLQSHLEELMDSPKDDVVTFEQLGVDSLMVDEAHEFKNLAVTTKMQNVAGISTSESQKATDLLMKTQYLDEITGGRGLVFCTGTPISNSPVELYTMMRYLQASTLRAMTFCLLTPGPPTSDKPQPPLNWPRKVLAIVRKHAFRDFSTFPSLSVCGSWPPMYRLPIC